MGLATLRQGEGTLLILFFFSPSPLCSIWLLARRLNADNLADARTTHWCLAQAHLDAADRARIERLEIFDEFEEWHMIQVRVGVLAWVRWHPRVLADAGSSVCKGQGSLAGLGES